MNEFLKKAIGIPWLDRGRDYSGWDCWGLVVCFYRDVLGIQISDYTGVSYNSILAVRKTIAESRKWIKIEFGKEQLGDCILWKPLHVGLVIEPRVRMLHCEVNGIETCLERYNNMLWRNRMRGIYRYA